MKKGPGRRGSRDKEFLVPSGTKSLATVQDLNKFWSDTKKFGPAQTILGPVEGQGMNLLPCPSTGSKMFSAGPKFLSQFKKFECI